jgi:carbamoyltransferase
MDMSPPNARPTYILGISAFYHDSAACLLRDGDIVAACSEERLTRKKGDGAFPARAVDFCLAEAGITMRDLSHVGFYDKPILKFERILETYFSVAPRGFRQFLMAGPLWTKEKLFLDRELREGWIDVGVVSLHEGPQEVLARTGDRRDGRGGRPDRVRAGLGARTLHLHDLLGDH